MWTLISSVRFRPYIKADTQWPIYAPLTQILVKLHSCFYYFSKIAVISNLPHSEDYCLDLREREREIKGMCTLNLKGQWFNHDVVLVRLISYSNLKSSRLGWRRVSVRKEGIKLEISTSSSLDFLEDCSGLDLWRVWCFRNGKKFVTWWLWEGETNEDIDLALFNLRVWKMCEKVREAVVFY